MKLLDQVLPPIGGNEYLFKVNIAWLIIPAHLYGMALIGVLAVYGLPCEDLQNANFFIVAVTKVLMCY